MNWVDAMRLFGPLSTVGMLVVFIMWMRRLKQQRIADLKLVELVTRLADSLDHAQERLHHAGLTLVSSMHCHYSVADEIAPGVHPVKCEDCNETIGTVEDPGHVISLAHGHVQEKYQQMRDDVRQREAARG